MRYSAEFKKDAVALVRAGASQSEVCRDLGISKSALSHRVAAADREAQGLPVAQRVSPAEDAQIRELMRRNGLLEQENEVLRCRVSVTDPYHAPKMMYRSSEKWLCRAPVFVCL